MTSVALLLLFGAVMPAVAQTGSESGSPRLAVVTRLHGKARFSIDDKTWQPVKNGIALRAGAVIQTAEHSTLDFRLGEGASGTGEPGAGTLQLRADTVLAIDRLGETTGTGPLPDVGLDLRAGEITGRVGTLPPGSRYEVKFSKGIVGVTEGLFQVTASGLISVPTGKVVVVMIGADGTPTTKVVTSGQMFNSGTGQLMPIPRSSAEELPPGNKPEASEPHNPAQPAPLNPARGQGMGGSLRRF